MVLIAKKPEKRVCKCGWMFPLGIEILGKLKEDSEILGVNFICPICQSEFRRSNPPINSDYEIIS